MLISEDIVASKLPMFCCYCQIGPTTASGASVVAGYSDIRLHQTADEGYAPNDVLRTTFMAVAFDLTDVEWVINERIFVEYTF